jgi:CheY-like chemotaxis protein
MAKTPTRILVVDDNFLNRVVLVSYLEGQGYHVAQAENGRQGLTELRVNDYDLLLLDILMPEMDGFQVLHAIRRDNR